jgi:hypothetical protein
MTGFEGATSRIDPTSTYVENGIQVEQVGQLGSDWINTFIMHSTYPGMGFSGLRSWYPNAGDFGYTRISLLGGGAIKELSLQVGNGHGDSEGITGVTGSTIGNWGQRVSLNYAAYKQGLMVDSGSIMPAGSGAILMLVSGGGFDSIYLSATYGAHLPQSGQFQALAIDDLRILSAVPEPETFALMLVGLGMLGFDARRRKRNCLANTPVTAETRNKDVRPANSIVPGVSS